METIHIIDQSSRDHLLNHLLKEGQSLINHRFVSFDQVFYPSVNHLERKLAALEIIKKYLEHFNLLKGSLHYHESIFQALSFLDLLDRYHIDLDSCPTDTPINKEKTEVLKLLASHISRPYQDILTIHQPIIIHPFYQQLYHQKVLNTQTKLPFLNPKITYKTALNRRQEVSGLIHHLKLNTFNNCLILIGDKDYLPILKQQNLEAQFLNETKIDSLFMGYYLLVKAVLEKDRDALLDFYKLNLNNDLEMFNFLEIADDYNLSFDELFVGLKPKVFNPSEVLTRNIEDEQNRYHQAFTFSQQLAQRFQTIDDNHLIESVFTLLAQSNTSSFQLKQILEENYSLTKKYPLLDVLEYSLLKNRSISHKRQPIVVADLNYQPSTEFDLIACLGLTSTNFPNAPTLTGLYNEAYVQQIKGFPLLKDRMNFHLRQLMNNFNISKELILSYPQMDYQGKAQQIAFEIEQLDPLSKPSLWQFDESKGQTSIIQNLQPEIAEKLFLKEQKLFASVSSLESFTTNSYKYFIERGLKIRSQEKLDFNNAMIGTISHHVMEILLDKFDKDYVSANEAQIAEILQPILNQLIEIYPTQKLSLRFKFKRLASNLTKSIQGFSDFEKKYQGETYARELEFNNLQLFESIPIILKGFVDRVDFVDDRFVVIDYKSSDHSLTNAKILNGQQLQLPTYALALQHELGKKCLLMAYFMMNLSLQKQSEFKLNSTQYNTLPHTDKHSFSKTKNFEKYLPSDSRPTSANLLDSDALKEYFEKLYTSLYQKISQGILNEFVNDSPFFDFNDSQRNQETYGEIDDYYLQIDPDANISQGGKK